ncbi:MAG: glutathione S-transferase C-terminal domain-containing protein [Myxococcales bacterium]|nr:glutathione S-transferase C-terminal domain-containing protein [Myxococcales bacterium]
MPDYVPVKEARALSGLRLVLTPGGPGPWSEAAKGFFQVKGLSYVPVLQDPDNAALREWTGQTLAPVAAYDAEPPAVALSDILWLAERLAPDPPLVPEPSAERATHFGLLREITGQQGFGWSRRLVMLGENLKRQPDGPGRDWTLAFAEKFRFTEAAVAHARRRVLEILGHLSDRLRDQAARGSRYFVGDALTGADIAWAAFAAMLAPLPHEICPMSRGLRRMYTATEPDVLAALDPILLEHRDAMYRDHLATPLDF